MSIQAECREAMNRLAYQATLFTEIDVANEAATDGWSSKHFDQAVRHAYNVLQGDYKKGKLVRFGPVDFNGVKDYARRGTKIVYADAYKGPKKFETPNGTFPRLLSANDRLSGPGRRTGTNRDDTKPWDGQTVTLKRQEPKGPPVDTAPLMRRINELESELKRYQKVNGTPALPTPVPALASAGGGVDALVQSLVKEQMDDLREKLAEALIS